MNELRSLTLKVELSAGTDIRDASFDLCELANRVGCLVEADFNGVKLWAGQNGNPLKLSTEFAKELQCAKQYKHAKSW